MENITPEFFNNELALPDRSKKIFIDVRTLQEYNHKNIPGVINMPLNEIASHIDELKKYEEVFVHCEVGSRSEYACMILEEMGISNTFNLTGGIFGWERSGYPVNR